MNTENSSTLKQRQPVVFISGPMTGKPDFNRDEFYTEASALGKYGFTVLNRAVLPEGLEHHQYLAMSLVMLEQADAIFLLEGWENSIGSRAEDIRARELGLMFTGQSWDVVRAAAAFQPGRCGRAEDVEQAVTLMSSTSKSPLRPYGKLDDAPHGLAGRKAGGGRVQ